MSRSTWKTIPIYNLKKKPINNNLYKIFNKNFIIVKDFVGSIFFVYTGRRFKRLSITSDMVGHYLSEFIFTKYSENNIHTKNKKKK